MTMETIYTENREQAILYECELKGQLSDGQWENSKPWQHWKVMCRAKAIYDPKKPAGRNFTPDRRYNFAVKELLDAVSDRMIWSVKFFNTYPEIDFENHFLIEDIMKTVKYSKEAKTADDYYVKAYQRLCELFKIENDAYTDSQLAAIVAEVHKFPYSMMDLRRDLKRLNMIVNDNLSIQAVVREQDNAKKPVCKLIGTDGNVFSIIGKVSYTLRKKGMEKESDEFIQKATKSSSYDAVLALCSEYVEVH